MEYGDSADSAAGLVESDRLRPYFRRFEPRLKVQQVSCGKEHVLLLTKTGTVYAMGLGR